MEQVHSASPGDSSLNLGPLGLGTVIAGAPEITPMNKALVW